MLADILQIIGDGIAWTIGIPLIWFMFTYAGYSPWRADPLGIERMFQKGYLFLLWVLIMAGNFLPDEFEMVRLIARIFVFATVTVMLSLQVVNLRRVQTSSAKPLFFTALTYKAQAARRLRRAERRQ